MPNAAPITVNDGTADVVFSPDAITGTHVQLQDLSEGNMSKRSLLHFDRPQKSNDVRRSARLNIPYTELDASGKEVVKTVTLKIEMVSPASAGVPLREAVLKMGSNLASNSAVKALFCNPEWMW